MANNKSFISNNETQARETRSGLLATLVKYTIVPSIPLVAIAIVSTNLSLWVGNDTHHFYFELFAVVFAAIVAIYGLFRAYQTKDRFSLLIGLAYLTSAIIDALHASLSYNAANETLFLGYFIPQTWFAGRTFISSVMVIAILRYATPSIKTLAGTPPPQQPDGEDIQREEKPDRYAATMPAPARRGALDKPLVSLSIIILTIVSATFLTVISFFTVLPNIVIGFPIHRPYEIPPLFLFSLALFLFYKKKVYRINDVFYKGILASLMLDVYSQIIMAYSANPFDTAHNVSHILKDASYFTNIISLALSSIQYNKIVKQNEQLIRASYERLKAADKIKDDFINIAAHELRTPLQPIISYSDLALNGMADKDEALKVIDRQAKRLQKLSSDILDVSRIESGNLSYAIEKVQINEAVLEAANSQKLSSQNVEMQTRFATPPGMTIEADRSRIMQVLTNIIGNAAKFTKQGFIRIETRYFAELNRLDIIISDTGPGIPAEILPNLFGKFVTKNAGSENYYGTGLGLFISKAIVAAHNGRISARNGEAGGAVFEISLPITQVEKMKNRVAEL
ncbi:sensor histidine kinase [Nitrososphaera viennensis]|uniref:histidine kinase n=2 Tax=Nitrososphaera viennensis TaxID=1034015 RepID=A0A060HDF3_9ARCH|nr:ATP-binding protein [Nitrososphaera viennensis]AIC14759.1 putative membrane associated signal transduction histidine kinase, with phosphoacceptor and ATP binding domain [Nitrososphaera viennensis EN76]UVS69717.1 ATP-binding protein [Nitrososphaera viennensis]